MSLEGVDHALRQRHDERDRISGDLLDLEGHTGHQLLDGAELSGVTQQRWAETQARVATLWWLFDAYKRVLEHAERVRARRPRPGQDELAELSALLTGPSVELKTEDVPVERRSLVAALGERLTLDEVVARMDTAYRDAAQMVAAADAAWSALLPRVEEADAARRAGERLLLTLESADPELDRLGRELADLRQQVRGDPLSFSAGPQGGDLQGGGPQGGGMQGRGPQGGGMQGAGVRIDTSRLEGVVAALVARRVLLEEAVRIREGFDARTRELGDRVSQIKSAEDDVRAARDRVLAKIASPVLPHLPSQAAALRDRLATIQDLRGRAAWTELAGRLTELDGALGEALRQAREATSAITALLDRRDELRGRLDAYRAKAVRLGQAEDAELMRLYEQARALLWTAPCDLRQATRTVAGYQRALRQIGADG